MMRHPHKEALCLAVLGTGSNVGKSLITTAFCRFFSNRGIRVAPFKAQNLSNNSGVTTEGLEMGRAQIVQAEAARIPAHVDMNPVLLKPAGETGSQVVILGNVSENQTAEHSHERIERLYETAIAALQRLRRNFELIIIEGAGSCAEVNLSAQDIANFRIAHHAHAPVILVADIDRGGVFAQIIGTLECLEDGQKSLIKGFIINRFSGDIGLFKSGVRWIEERTGNKVLGVLPWHHHIHIEAEDAVVIKHSKPVIPANLKNPAIAVIRLPHISNFNDFDPLSALPILDVYFLESVQDLSSLKAVVLPGSKNTRFDLNWLISTGWDREIDKYSRNGGHVLGICGGYQMLGGYVHDPDGLEGKPGSTEGLGLLPVETVLKAPKTTSLTRFCWHDVQGSGYEIHMGQTRRTGGEPLFRIIRRNNTPAEDNEGCAVKDFRILGTYIHGLFDNPKIAKKWLAILGCNHIETSSIGGPSARDKQYDLLAEHLEKYIDTDYILTSLNPAKRQV
jgi:adenosylcobyric acid synthase